MDAQQAIASTFAMAHSTPSTRAFFELMDALHDQIESDHRASQDISTAFVEEMFDAADDNVLMFKAMSRTCSDEELGKYVRILMLSVARDRAV